MKKMILIALLISGWASAQITINDRVYLITEPEVAQVWGLDVPWRITSLDNRGSRPNIFVDTNTPQGFNLYPLPPVGSHPDDLPELRYYDTGGSVQLPIPTANSGTIVIPFFESTEHMTFQWWWPRSGFPDRPLQIGGEYHVTRN